ncbi:hypothetical protein BX616_010106 [Lobosporangium transversale]|uniref:RING-type domain-containing protein n=1 Tax=Lobosporangium transversale TaxID=64571 RepID=A0A1Y2GQB8_9FUNG|nr:hypothetical protein BCR41DRAFT_353171 [Lobosporangium transversale]KAF9918152.1 hypothetical protein BX616_010106 [Lobosporangium transversale]ORZ16784.1 hypothetical protein BCR41DRAFT_353171 [Lobosporangium transversale]|eukprot:XP_021881719.1 hypothetical protein BCR41DRAFT_353171 [Lobosporangium transversale]
MNPHRTFMPSKTMTSTSGKANPPHCFCRKPSTVIYTELEGIVYECHYTNLNLWLERHVLVSSPAAQQDTTSNSSTTSTVQSSPVSAHSPASPANTASRNTYTRSLSAGEHDRSPVFKEVNEIIKDLAAHTNEELASSWEIFLQKRPTNRSTNGNYNNDNNNTNNTNTTIKNHNTSSTFDQLFIEWKLQNITLSLPPKHKHQKLVCGFHMHASIWEAFKDLAWDPTRDNRQHSLSSEKKALALLQRDRVCARKHHGLVFKHRDMHDQLIRMAEETKCDAHAQTIGRWTHWREKVCYRRSSPSGGAPACFCGRPMKCSLSHPGGHDSAISYFCAYRLEDGKRGCSRVLNAGKWLRWQPLDPIHTLASHHNAQPGDDIKKEVTVSIEADKESNSEDELDRPLHDNDSLNVGDPMKQESESEQESDDGGEGWDQPANHESFAPCTLKPLALPAGLIYDGTGCIERINAPRMKASLPIHTFDQSMALDALVKQLEDRSDSLVTGDTITLDELKQLELRLKRWQDSCGRLQDYSRGLHEDGLDNPTLTCRVCKEGILQRAVAPCFHLAMCDRCIRNHTHCVVCHTKIESTPRIYWG